MTIGISGQKTILSTYPYLELNNQGQIIKLELTKNQHILGRDSSEGADLLVPQDWKVISRYHARFNQEGEDYRIYDGDGNKGSTNGLFLDRTRITPTEGYYLQNDIQIRIGQDPKTQILLTYFNPASATTPPTQHSISLKNRSVELGRDRTATLQLNSPIISRRHATIEPTNQGRYLLRDYSSNGVFVNGQRVSGSALLENGATIRIGPFMLQLRGDELLVVDRGEEIRLDAENLAIPGRLQSISLVIEPRQLVALVGGSGTGKSTLLRSLLGIETISSGEMYLNGDNLPRNFNIYRTQIGYVPQDDIIHIDLTVAEVLTYAAQLRLPPDIDVIAVVDKTLNDIEMSQYRHQLVRHLSGGQRKRVSIGAELLANPKLFFLDEPTSGLDPGLDKKMMQLLQRLAHQEGRTIILVTHATANITLCDRIAFLGRGGWLCYFGPPTEALGFFQVLNSDFAEIYIKLEEHESSPINWANQFQSSQVYHRYISHYLSTKSKIQQPDAGMPQPVKRSPLQQLSLLAQRYARLVWRDRVSLILSLITAPIGISSIALAIRDKNPLILGNEDDPTLAPLALRVLFVFTCAAIWVGLSTSLQEVVKESSIYQRERLVNLGIIPYLGSKILVLSGLAILQTLLIVVVILLCFKSPQPDLISWPIGLGITTFLTLITSFSLGLMVSAAVKNGSQANSALPLLLLPQIIFSGVLFKMEGIGSYISWLMLSRWSVGAYGALVDVNRMVPPPTQIFGGTTLPQPFEPTSVYEPTWTNLSLNWGMLCVHTVIYWLITWWLQRRKDIFKFR